MYTAVCIGGPFHGEEGVSRSDALTLYGLSPVGTPSPTYEYTYREWWVTGDRLKVKKIPVWMYSSDGEAEARTWLFGCEQLMYLFMAYSLQGPEAPAETGEQILERLFGRTS